MAGWCGRIKRTPGAARRQYLATRIRLDSPHQADTSIKKPKATPALPAEIMRYPFADLGHETPPRQANILIKGLPCGPAARLV